MLRPIAAVAAAGFLGVLIYKLLWMLLLPVFAVVIGVVGLVLKIALIAGIVWLGIFLFRKLTERPSEA